VPLFRPQIPYRLTWIGAHASAVTARLLTRLSHGPAHHLFYTWPACTDRRVMLTIDNMYIYVQHVQMWLPHVEEVRVFQIGTFPALFLTPDLTLHFDETVFCAIHVCNYQLRLRKSRHHTNSRKGLDLATVK
jgi:hypothetical protein